MCEFQLDQLLPQDLWSIDWLTLECGYLAELAVKLLFIKYYQCLLWVFFCYYYWLYSFTKLFADDPFITFCIYERLPFVAYFSMFEVFLSESFQLDFFAMYYKDALVVFAPAASFLFIENPSRESDTLLTYYLVTRIYPGLLSKR